MARGPDGECSIRTAKVSEHPGNPTGSVYVSGQVATVLRFDKEVDPAKTKLLAWEGRFEPLLIGSKKVVLEPLRDLAPDEVVPLLVTLVDGTEIPFLVRPPIRGERTWTDHQINVFKDPDSYSGMLSTVYDALKRERALSEENQRFREEENSVDHALATLLVKGEVKKTPFHRKKSWRSNSDGMDVTVKLFSGPGKAAVLIHLRNPYPGFTWKFASASLTHDLTGLTARPFAVRLDQPQIAPGESGTIAVVVDQSAFAGKGGQWVDLALDIFRDDGLIEVAVTLDHSLIQE